MVVILDKLYAAEMSVTCLVTPNKNATRQRAVPSPSLPPNRKGKKEDIREPLDGVPERLARVRDLLGAQPEVVAVLQEVLWIQIQIRGVDVQSVSSIANTHLIKCKRKRTSNIAIALLSIALSYPPARARASMHLSQGRSEMRTRLQRPKMFTYQRVHRQKVPSSPPTPSSVFDTSYRYTKP